MQFEMFESKQQPGEWIVEGINTAGEGEIAWAHFYGWNAELRAREYIDWMLSRADRQQ